MGTDIELIKEPYQEGDTINKEEVVIIEDNNNQEEGITETNDSIENLNSAEEENIYIDDGEENNSYEIQDIEDLNGFENEESFEVDENMEMGDMLGDSYYGDNFEMTGGMETSIKDPFLSSWVPIITISSVTLIIAVALGILLAKRRIKKGIDLYED